MDGAGPVPEVLHRALIVCARLVRSRWVRSLSPLAAWMLLATNRLSWGEHRGGMFVAVTGRNAAGDAIERSWHLLAEGDDGPDLREWASLRLVIRAAMLDGRAPQPGARAAVRDASSSPIYGAAVRSVAHLHGDAGRRRRGAAVRAAARRRVARALPAEIRRPARFAWSGLVGWRGHGRRQRAPRHGIFVRALSNLPAAPCGFPEAWNETSVTVRFAGPSGGRRGRGLARRRPHLRSRALSSRGRGPRQRPAPLRSASAR